jgi:hypothetical protein
VIGFGSTLTISLFTEEREKALLRLLPIKKVESNEAVDFLSSIPNVKREEKSVVLPSTSRGDSTLTLRLTCDGKKVITLVWAGST